MSQPKKNSAGGRIETIRGELGVGEFASALGVNRKTVTRWEADDSLPDGASLIALRERFGADPGWVLTGSGEPPNTSSLTPDEEVLLEGYRALDPATRRRMLAFMLTGSEPAPSGSKTVTVTAHGGQAAGRNIKN